MSKTDTRDTITVPIVVDESIYMTGPADISSEWKGEKVRYTVQMGSGMPVLYYRGKTAVIPLQELATAMLEAIERHLADPAPVGRGRRG